MRKLFLTGFVFLIPQHVLRLLLAEFVAIAHLVLLPIAAPYKQPSTMFSAIATSVTLVWTLNVALLIAMYEELEKQQVMSFFGFESVLILASIIFSFNMLVLIMALALSLYQLRVESHSYATRRLRYKDGSEVLAPPLGSEKKYHLFLSHVWGTGQDQMRIVKQRILEMVGRVRVFLGKH